MTVPLELQVDGVAASSANPIPVGGTITVADLPPAPLTDYFGLALIGQRYNHSEVHLDNSDWASFGTETKSGGAATPTSTLGRVAFTSGTGANGSYSFVTLDQVDYDPFHGIYGAATAAFVTHPTGASDKALLWLLQDATRDNGLAIGDYLGVFGLHYFKGGALVFTKTPAQWAATPTGYDNSKGYIYFAECGLFGYAGWTVQVSQAGEPRGTFVTIYDYEHVGTSADPAFTNFDFKQGVQIVKSASDATNVEIRSACWAAGTTSPFQRLNSAISDRTLGETVRSVQWGKATNGTYVPIAVNNNGRMLVSNDAVGTDGAAVPTSATAVGGTDGTNLQTLRLDSSGNVLPRDFFSGGEVLADQTAAGSALTFTFSSAVQVVQVMTTGVEGRVDPFGGTPSASLGIRVLDDTPTLIPVQTSSVKVFAASGAVNVIGFRY